MEEEDSDDPVTTSFHIWAHCTHGWWCKCQDDFNGSITRELEETSRASSYHVVEHHPAWPESIQPRTEWSSRPGPEPSSVQADVYIWCYALLVVKPSSEQAVYVRCHVLLVVHPRKEDMCVCDTVYLSQSCRVAGRAWHAAAIWWQRVATAGADRRQPWHAANRWIDNSRNAAVWWMRHNNFAATARNSFLSRPAVDDVAVFHGRRCRGFVFVVIMSHVVIFANLHHRLLCFLSNLHTTPTDTIKYKKLVPCGTDSRLLLSGFQALVTLTLTLDRVILHTVMHHSSTSIYIPNFTEIWKTFCGRTDRRTYVHTEGHFRPPLMLLGPFGEVDLKSNDVH